MTRDSAPFGALLNSARVQSGLSRGKLAEAAGLHRSIITRFESGAKRPRRATVARLALALRLDESDTDALMLAAGFAPENLDATREPEVFAILALLADPTVPLRQRHEIRSALRTIAQITRGEIGTR